MSAKKSSFHVILFYMKSILNAPSAVVDDTVVDEKANPDKGRKKRRRKIPGRASRLRNANQALLPPYEAHPQRAFLVQSAKNNGGGTYLKQQKKTKVKRHTTPGYSPVVTDPTTSLAVTDLSRGERTGSRVFAQVPMVVCMLLLIVAVVCGRRGW